MTQKGIELFDELVANNNKLLKLLQEMTPEDRKEFAPRVQQMITDTWKLMPTTPAASEAPTILLQQLTWNEDDENYPDIKHNHTPC